MSPGKAPVQGDKTGRVLVLGAGIAGIRASLDVAAAGYEVLLVDSAPAMGGVLASLDQQFPTDHCGMCRMLPEVGAAVSARFCLRKGLYHDRIDVWLHTFIEKVQGQCGAFRVQCRKKALLLDASHCGDCSAPCQAVCPISVPDEQNQGLTLRKAIYRPANQALGTPWCIDPEACNRCGKCADICPAGAIDLDARDSVQEVEVDVLIFATGSESVSSGTPDFDPVSAHHGVMTALQFERFVGLAGPRRTQLFRPSDGRPLRHIAWLQCIGSRDPKHGRDICSSTCCAFALKQARLVRRIGGGQIDATIFYMDIRGSGKWGELNRKEAERLGVRLVRTRTQALMPAADGGILLRAMDETSGQVTNIHADLVVLATGQKAAEPVERLIEQVAGPWRSKNPSLLSPHDQLEAAPGVLVCGSALEPTDIAGAVVGGTAAASQAVQALLRLGRTTASSQPPAFREVDETEKTLVLVCQCHLDGLAGSPPQVPGADVRLVPSPCLPGGMENLRSLLRSTHHPRVVFAACRPHAERRTFERLAQREGVDEAHRQVVSDRLSQTALTMAVAALEANQPVPEEAVPQYRPFPRVLVVGGGISGMQAAWSLAERGIDVDLVESRTHLGGMWSRDGFGPEPVVEVMKALEKKVRDADRIRVHLGTRLVATERVPEGWISTLQQDHQQVAVWHGATILAVGAKEKSINSYCYGDCDRVLTQTRFERSLQNNELDPGSVVVMIQCVETRQGGASDVCSRVCCLRALRHAIFLRRTDPRSRVVIVYRDMMAWGRWEQEYTLARRLGVVFVSYHPDRPPQVSLHEDKPVVQVWDPVLGRAVRVTADWLVLSSSLEASVSNGELARILGLELDGLGYFREVDPKWRPVDTAVDGVYLAGTCHSPQLAGEALLQAQAAAQRAYERLTMPPNVLPSTVATVRHELCARCGLCIEACVFKARWLDPSEDRVVVDAMACRSCGACVSACHNGSARLASMGEGAWMAQVEASISLISLGKNR